MFTRILALGLFLSVFSLLQAQDQPASTPGSDAQGETTAPAETPNKPESGLKSTEKKIEEAASKLASEAKREMDQLATKLDQNPRAKEVAAGILQPIYVVAEALAFPAFHWVAFALMAAGVVSFALQLVLGKLVVLTRLGFSFKEIASDAVGLTISVFGLVLTTQAAAENSTFTQSAAAVLSATAVGAIGGIVLYAWGQSQELEAAAGRSKLAATHKK